jgi:subfamily B ATP-binding cassette protein MsbA
MKETKAIKTLIPLLKLYPVGILAITTLGILSSVSEGLGISLFVPFLQNIGQKTNQSITENFLIHFLNQLFIHIAPDQRLLVISLCIFGSALLKNSFSYSSAIFYSWLYLRMSYQLHCSVFKQLLSVSYSFLDSNQSGKLLNTLHTQTWEAVDATFSLVDLIVKVFTIFVFAILLLLTSWQLTLFAVVALGLISITIQQVSYQARELGRQAVQANDVLANRMMEGFYAMRLIRTFGNESYEQKRFEQAFEQVCTASMNLDKLRARIGPLSEVLAVALLGGILLISLQNQANLPTSLAFILMLYRLQPHVRSLDDTRISLITSTAAVEDVMSFLDRSNKPYIHSGRIPFKGLKQTICFESVYFHYNPLEKPALRNVSIRIPQGKTTAIVGPSGAGKSTLLGLICRFYDVTDGEIYIDNYPLRQLNLASWRSRIALVSQDIYIFSTTVRENIAYGRLDATEAEIIAAATQANAHEFISRLPQGYDTMVGDRGIRLSGGQRQRVALARAIVRKPEILILDEATNALDSVSERLIQEALDTFSQNRTVIVIAHRLSTIEQADQIIVLQEGQVIEQGNLQQLLKLNGLFAKFYYMQYRSAQT